MERYRSPLERQRSFFQTGVTKSVAWKLDQLERLECLLRENKQAFSDALGQDLYKSPFEQWSEFEISIPLGIIDYFRQNPGKLLALQDGPLPMAPVKEDYCGEANKAPNGPTLVIGPAITPVLLLLDPTISVLVAGNPVILKPAAEVPTVAALLQTLIPKFTPEAVAIVTMALGEVTALQELPFAFIFFTGRIVKYTQPQKRGIPRGMPASNDMVCK